MKQVLEITLNTVQVTDFRSLRMAGNDELRLLFCPSETNWILVTQPVYCRVSDHMLSYKMLL
jgi:hypothetical protein